MLGLAQDAVEKVNTGLGSRALGVPFIAKDLVVGRTDIGGLSQRGLQALQHDLDVNKHNESIALKPSAVSFEEDGELVEGVHLRSNWMTRHRQHRVMEHALRAANISSDLELPGMDLVIARMLPGAEIDMNMTDMVDSIANTVVGSVGLVHLDPVQVRPIDDGTVVRVHFRSAS